MFKSTKPTKTSYNRIGGDRTLGHTELPPIPIFPSPLLLAKIMLFQTPGPSIALAEHAHRADIPLLQRCVIVL